MAQMHLASNAARMTTLRQRLIDGLMARVPGTRLNGHPTERLPGNANLSFDKVEGEALLLRLDLMGVAGSSGSACTSGTLDPSHVLRALGLTQAQANGALRLTIGTDTTEEEIDQVLDILPPIVEDLRRMVSR
jgi:cysteine desulfurase